MQNEFLKENEVIEQAVTAAISDGFTEGSVTDLIRAPRNAPAGAITPAGFSSHDAKNKHRGQTTTVFIW